tara:strand:- start:125 stop:487 length:363 start_codon:yes stop_codon:yes gene_type:complete
MKEKIDLPGAAVYGPYSPGVKFNNFLWLSGQISPESGESITDQTTGSLEKIDALLTNAGFTKRDVCFVQILLDDINDFAKMNQVYQQWLPDEVCFPARAAFQASQLPANAKIEIIVQAMR